MAQCTATSKRTGERCGAQAMTGRHVCRHHGGKSLVGPASPQWHDGGRSKYLPKRLLADYQASLNNPDKLALNGEIALLDARLADILKRIDAGESGQLWRDLMAAVREYEAAQRARDTAGVAVAVNTIMDLISRGSHDAASWSEVRAVLQERRRLVESERKRLVEAQQVISLDQAMAMMSVLVDSVRTHVRDDATLRAVTAQFARLTGQPFPMAERPEWDA